MVDERTSEKAWKDDRENEYARLDSALRHRLNLTLSMNVQSALSEPSKLLMISDALNDIWDCFRHHVLDEPELSDIDTRLKRLTYEGRELSNTFAILKNERSSLDDLYLSEEERRLYAFYDEEKEIFRVIMELRHRKRMDISTKTSYGSGDLASAFKQFATGGVP